jgi:glycosyltransferase involved in cell wall biosynthesis
VQSRVLRILHIHNTGGQATKLVRALRELGCIADCIVFGQEFLSEQADIRVQLAHPRWLSRQVSGLSFLFRLAPLYDVFHFHVTSFIRFSLDLLILRMLRKTIVIHYHGMELVRQFERELAIKLYGSPYSFARKFDNSLRLWTQQNFANHILISTPNLWEYIPYAEWFPQPIDITEWCPVEQQESWKQTDEVKIVHCPSNPRTKGTEFIVRAVEDLQQQNYKVSLLIVHGVRHHAVRSYLEQGDIFVDQLLVGQYGNAAIEALAMGLPTICYLDPAFCQYLSDCPIIQAKPETLTEVLRELIINSDKWPEIRDKSRHYAQRVHDIRVLAARLLQLYTNILI